RQQRQTRSRKRDNSPPGSPSLRSRLFARRLFQRTSFGRPALFGSSVFFFNSLHLSEEAITPPWQSFHIRRFFRRIGQCLPQFIDRLVETVLEIKIGRA